MGVNDIFWRYDCPSILFFTQIQMCVHVAHAHTAKICDHMHGGKSLLSLSECSCSISHIHPHIYLSKLHVSCYLWWDSGELYDLSSFSLIIAIMRIKALKIAVYALLVVLFIHIHEDGRIWGLLGCQYINLRYLSHSLLLSLSHAHSLFFFSHFQREIRFELK